MNAVNTAFDNGYAAGRDDARRRAELVVSERDAEITRLRAEVERKDGLLETITQHNEQLLIENDRLCAEVKQLRNAATFALDWIAAGPRGKEAYDKLKQALRTKD